MRKSITDFIVFLFVCLLFISVGNQKAEASSLDNNPDITFSPDGEAFTTNSGRQDVEWYGPEDSFDTGILPVVRDLQTGEHEYSYSRKGIVPIGRWEVIHIYAQCIHNHYISSNWHGLNFGANICGRNYFSGWFAYCADCGAQVTNMLIYASKATVHSLTDLNTRLDYYYLCPFCSNLEQGAGFERHNCRGRSWNKYKVVYDPNAGSGSMEASYHMYNNAEIYEGEPVAPVSHLSANRFTRSGYEFTGWNTKRDGTGMAFTDCQKILNLSSDNYSSANESVGVVRLYAQWRLNLTLNAAVERILEPHDPIFRGGESGVLKITTTGNADRVEVIFPGDLTAINPGLNKTYVYNPSSYMKQEELTFLIPLNAPAKSYAVTVRAYRGGVCLEKYPGFIVKTGGNVLKHIKKHLK